MFAMTRMVDPRVALPGRDTPILAGEVPHDVFGVDVRATPAGSQVAYFALGCFWGAEKLFWTTPGVTNTASGYLGGYTPNPTYEQVCSGRTGHAEAVRVCFDPERINYTDLLRIFFENHDPTQGMRQGNDLGTQYRSALFPADAAQAEAAASAIEEFGRAFAAAGYSPITTAVDTASAEFYFAERYHQQYLFKNPGGYCPIHATGVTCGRVTDMTRG